MREKLWQSYRAVARAAHFSRRPGQRFDCLDALARAAAIRRSPQLRDAAIACLPLPDIRPAAPGTRPPPVTTPWSPLEIRDDPGGTLTLTRRADGRVLARLPSRHGKASGWE